MREAYDNDASTRVSVRALESELVEPLRQARAASGGVDDEVGAQRR